MHRYAEIDELIDPVRNINMAFTTADIIYIRIFFLFVHHFGFFHHFYNDIEFIPQVQGASHYYNDHKSLRLYRPIQTSAT